ncbi:MAG: DUF4091 domain-containing protein, partial [Spirochaetales bacterium]
LSSNGNTIAATNYNYHFVDFLRSRTNSRYNDSTDPDAVLESDGIKWVNISNPMRKTSLENMVEFPEILSNDKTRFFAKDTTHPIWIKLKIPENTEPGDYTGTINIATTSTTYTVPISVAVKDVTIPASNDSNAFDIEIWSQLVGNFDTEVDVIVDAYNIEVESEEWWTVMNSFATLMKENRLNVLMLNQTELLLRGENTHINEDGTYTFDWSFFNEFVTFFKDYADIKLFALGPLAQYKANPRNYNNDIEGEEKNDYTQAYVEIIANDDSGNAISSLLDVNLSALILKRDIPAMNYVEEYAKSLNDNLEKMGWKDIFYHHIIDEPGKDQQASLYPFLEAKISENVTGLKTGDAFTVWTAEQQSKHTEIFAIMLYSYEELTDRMQNALKPDDTLWLYTSSVPIKDNYLNRAIDQPVWFMEMLGYLAYKRGATGYLHWGLNQWNTWTRDYISFPNYPRDEMWDKVMGDASSVYPDIENLSLRSSIRVEALRETSELVSILWIAEQKNPEQTKELVDSLIEDGRNYETDINKIIAAYETALAIASENVE